MNGKLLLHSETMKKIKPEDIGQHIADQFSEFSKTDGQVSVTIQTVDTITLHIIFHLLLFLSAKRNSICFPEHIKPK